MKPETSARDTWRRDGVDPVIKVNQRQMETFEAQARERFIAQATAHAQTLGDGSFAALDPQAQRQAVEQVITVAEHYAISGEAATICLLEATCALGWKFPSEPEHQWARSLLEAQRADERRTLEYLRDTALQKASAGSADA